MEIEKIKRKLLVKHSFFGSVLANSNIISDEFVETIQTDGRNIYFNPKFLESVTEQQQVFLFAHEICHIAFDHISRCRNRDPELWNIATDAVVNANLKEEGFSLVENGIDIPDAINYDAEEFYNKLLNEKNKQSNNLSQNDNVGHSTHSMWKKALENEKETSSKDKKIDDEDKCEKINQNKEDIKDSFDNQIKKLSQVGEKEAFKQDRNKRKKQLEELRKSLVSTSHGHGNDTDGNLRNVSDIGISKSLFDWRKILKESIKYEVDWSYQNAEIEEGVVKAYLEKYTIPETEIVLDTSGSINENLLRNFLRECKNILQHSKVKVGCFDIEFYGFQEIRTEGDIENMQFQGGGGTDFDVAVNAFSNRVENKIIFTDGKADMPEKSVDVIWIVFGDKKINPKGGKVINITDEQLEKLLTNFNTLKQLRKTR